MANFIYHFALQKNMKNKAKINSKNENGKNKAKSKKIMKIKNKNLMLKILSAIILFSFLAAFLFFLKNVNSKTSVIEDSDQYLDAYKEERLQMVDTQLRARDITDERVLEAMEKVPRHMFMPHSRNLAYRDHPVPIGYGQTISQPYIVALMAQELRIKEHEKILEIGAGSGYNAAVLAELAKEVYTIEIIGELAEWSENALKKTGYSNVYVKHADGYYGWEGKEFDAVIITAAANHVPQPLIDQLKIGGRLILPLSSPAGFQALTIINKTDEGLKTRSILGVRFVPMTGKAMES